MLRLPNCYQLALAAGGSDTPRICRVDINDSLTNGSHQLPRGRGVATAKLLQRGKRKTNDQAQSGNAVERNRFHALQNRLEQSHLSLLAHCRLSPTHTGIGRFRPRLCEAVSQAATHTGRSLQLPNFAGSGSHQTHTRLLDVSAKACLSPELSLSRSCVWHKPRVLQGALSQPNLPCDLRRLAGCAGLSGRRATDGTGSSVQRNRILSSKM